MTQKLTQYVCHDGDFLCPFVCIDGLSRCLTGTSARRATLRCADACYDPVKFRFALNSSDQNATLTPSLSAASTVSFMDSPLPTPTACRLAGYSISVEPRAVLGCFQLPIIVGTFVISTLGARKCLVESQLDGTGKFTVARLRSFIILDVFCPTYCAQSICSCVFFPAFPLRPPSTICQRERLQPLDKWER
jgi:hypothetical protein